MTKNSQQYRQGDVFIVRTGALPEGLDPVARESGRVILAHGEVTGHAHAIKDRGAKLFRDPKLAKVFLQVTGDDAVGLTHEEHTRIDLVPGNYEVIIQREYSPETVRNVAD